MVLSESECVVLCESAFAAVGWCWESKTSPAIMSKKRRPLSTKKADDAKKNVPPGYTLEEWLAFGWSLRACVCVCVFMCACMCVCLLVWSWCSFVCFDGR